MVESLHRKSQFRLLVQTELGAPCQLPRTLYQWQQTQTHCQPHTGIHQSATTQCGCGPQLRPVCKSRSSFCLACEPHDHRVWSVRAVSLTNREPIERINISAILDIGRHLQPVLDLGPWHPFQSLVLQGSLVVSTSHSRNKKTKNALQP